MSKHFIDFYSLISITRSIAKEAKYKMGSTHTLVLALIASIGYKDLSSSCQTLLLLYQILQEDGSAHYRKLVQRILSWNRARMLEWTLSRIYLYRVIIVSMNISVCLWKKLELFIKEINSQNKVSTHDYTGLGKFA